MTDNVLTSLITSSGMSLTAIAALALNYHGFTSIQHRFNSLERRLEVIEKDLKEFYQQLSAHDKRISKLEDK